MRFEFTTAAKILFGPGTAREVPALAHSMGRRAPVSYTHLRAHETVLDLVCRLLLEKKKKNKTEEEQTDKRQNKK